MDTTEFSLSLLGLAVETLVGAFALSAINITHIGKVFAVFVLLAVGLSVAGLRVRPTRPALLTGGGLAGVNGYDGWYPRAAYRARFSERTAGTG